MRDTGAPPAPYRLSPVLSGLLRAWRAKRSGRNMPRNFLALLDRWKVDRLGPSTVIVKPYIYVGRREKGRSLRWTLTRPSGKSLLLSP